MEDFQNRYKHDFVYYISIKNYNVVLFFHLATLIWEWTIYLSEHILLMLSPRVDWNYLTSFFVAKCTRKYCMDCRRVAAGRSMQ